MERIIEIKKDMELWIDGKGPVIIIERRKNIQDWGRHMRKEGEIVVPVEALPELISALGAMHDGRPESL